MSTQKFKFYATFIEAKNKYLNTRVDIMKRGRYSTHKNFLEMMTDDYEFLLELVGPRITKDYGK